MDMHQQHCLLGAWLQGNLSVSSVLESVLPSIVFSYVHRTEYKTNVDMAGVKNKLDPSKIRPNKNEMTGQRQLRETGKEKKHLMGLKQARIEVDVANKRFRKETVFFFYMETSEWRKLMSMARSPADFLSSKKVQTISQWVTALIPLWLFYVGRVPQDALKLITLLSCSRYPF